MLVGEDRRIKTLCGASRWADRGCCASITSRIPMALPHRAMRVIMLRIVLAQQVPPVVIAIWCAHHRMNVITRRRIIVVHDAGLVIELDEDYRAQDPIVEG